MRQPESGTVESYTAGAAASISDTVPCGAHRKNWDALEHDYTQADRYEQALTLAIIGELCRPCPALAECATWAVSDKYTGLAAGTWYRAGRRARPSRPRGLKPDPSLSPADALAIVTAAVSHSTP